MPDLSESPGDAARRRLTLLLRAAVERGDYPDGRLPSDEELAESYDVSRGVVRDALAALAETGVLTRIRGMGTRAPEHRGAVFNLLSFRGSSGIPEYRLHPRVIERAVVPTPGPVAARLPNAGDTVLRVEYLSMPAEDADGISTGFFVLPKGDGLREAEFGENLYTFLTAGGLTVSGTDFVIGAIDADRFTALRLRTKPAGALLFVEQTTYDEVGDPLSFSVAALRGDRLALYSRARADERETRSSGAG
ncbi:MAG: GntR family transcriptional regulator [Microbacterium sp.]|uniref:GntR family transcriptional regulator n=2 Tax=Microbacterium sp. TaxID=51671 RepID=UPI001ACC02CE|nr:GntR family transcriptional regulator [Microbacterium sp.]MBN9153863.1 GntR family transcriptional regulator [Microbacterium sp.]